MTSSAIFSRAGKTALSLSLLLLVWAGYAQQAQAQVYAPDQETTARGADDQEADAVSDEPATDAPDDSSTPPSDVATDPQEKDRELELRIEFSATTSCPGKSDFVRQLASRLRDGRTSEIGRLVVSIARQDDRFVGTLSQFRSEGLSEERRIEGSTCDEVIQALSMVAAVALEPADDAEEVIDGGPPLDDPANVALVEETPKPIIAPPVPTPRFSLDVQAGVTVGALPKMTVPRLDFALSYAPWVRPWKGDKYKRAIFARTRFNYLFRTKSTGAEQRVDSMGNVSDLDYEIVGFSITAGGCFAPWFNPNGASLAGCLDAGISRLVTIADAERGGYIFHSFGVRLGASIEGSYALDELFHLTTRLGYEGNILYDTYEPDADNTEFVGFYPRRSAIYATVGVGIHF